MKITLPENISEITLGQFQKYNDIVDSSLTENEKERRIIALFANIDLDLIGKINIKDYKEIIEQIVIALNTETEFEQRFTFKNVEFGFHTNLNNMSTNEYIDLQEYQNDVSELHRVMAILFRPIVKEDNWSNYSIEDYSGTNEYAEIMKDLPMNIVNGALGFFLNLANELENYIQKYTQQELARVNKHLTISKNGGGMQR